MEKTNHVGTVLLRVSVIQYKCLFGRVSRTRAKGFGVLRNAVQVLHNRLEEFLLVDVVLLRPLEVAQQGVDVVHTGENQQHVHNDDAGK